MTRTILLGSHAPSWTHHSEEWSPPFCTPSIVSRQKGEACDRSTPRVIWSQRAKRHSVVRTGTAADGPLGGTDHFANPCLFLLGQTPGVAFAKGSVKHCAFVSLPPLSSKGSEGKKLCSCWAGGGGVTPA